MEWRMMDQTIRLKIVKGRSDLQLKGPDGVDDCGRDTPVGKWVTVQTKNITLRFQLFQRRKFCIPIPFK
eukprot:2368987-Amphidinium_carterae.1